MSHYDVVSAESLEECKARCVANQGCVGIDPWNSVNGLHFLAHEDVSR